MTEHDQKRIAELAGSASAALPGLSGPRRALAERVVRHKDDLAEALLACLDLVAELHEAIAGDAAADALGAAQELAGAARLITFTASADDREVPLHPHTWGGTPARPTGPLLENARRLLGEPSSATHERGQELLDQLEELLRDVILGADMQGYVDAHATERAYLSAATRISRAALLVAAASWRG